MSKLFKSKQSKDRRSPKKQEYSSTYGYYSSRTRPESPNDRQNINETVEQNKLRWWHHIPTIMALVALLVSAGYVLTLNSNPKIALFSDDQSQYLVKDTSVYQKSAQRLLKKSLFNQNKLTIDTIDIASKLKSEFPELEKVSITIPLSGRRPIFELAPSRPVLILNTGNESFVLNSKGIVLAKTVDVPKRSNLSVPILLDKTAIKPEVGELSLSAGTVEFITNIEAQLKVKSLKIASMELPAIANELHIKIEGQQYYIKFNTAGKAREQVGTYLAVKDKLTADNVVPAEYIDVRIDERAYYR